MIAVSLLGNVIKPKPFAAVTARCIFVDSQDSFASKPFGQLGVPDSNRSAFPACDIFYRVKREAGHVPEVSNATSFVGRSEGVGRVFNNADVVSLSENSDTIHIARNSAV